MFLKKKEKNLKGSSFRIQDEYLSHIGAPWSLERDYDAFSKATYILLWKYIEPHACSAVVKESTKYYVKDKMVLGFDWLQTIKN